MWKDCSSSLTASHQKCLQFKSNKNAYHYLPANRKQNTKLQSSRECRVWARAELVSYLTSRHGGVFIPPFLNKPGKLNGHSKHANHACLNVTFIVLSIEHFYAMQKVLLFFTQRKTGASMNACSRHSCPSTRCPIRHMLSAGAS